MKAVPAVGVEVDGDKEKDPSSEGATMTALLSALGELQESYTATTWYWYDAPGSTPESVQLV